jgi:hypothetical protein
MACACVAHRCDVGADEMAVRATHRACFRPPSISCNCYPPPVKLTMTCGKLPAPFAFRKQTALASLPLYVRTDYFTRCTNGMELAASADITRLPLSLIGAAGCRNCLFIPLASSGCKKRPSPAERTEICLRRASGTYEGNNFYPLRPGATRCCGIGRIGAGPAWKDWVTPSG